MKFARKQLVNPFAGLTYHADKDKMYEILDAEQHHFCAYTEIYLEEAQAKPELEHFYPKSLYLAQENDYENLYLTTGYINRGVGSKGSKPPPAGVPYPHEVWNKVVYNPRTYEVEPLDTLPQTEKDNIENLILFLNLNGQLLVGRREQHCKCINALRNFLNDDELIEHITSHPFENIHFISLLETIFNWDLYGAFIGSQPPTP